MSDKLDWKTVDVTTLPAIVQEDYRQYKAAYAAAKAKREVFENALRKSKARPGQRMAVNYNFGKLSIAWTAATDAPPRTSKGSVSFADL